MSDLTQQTETLQSETAHQSVNSDSVAPQPTPVQNLTQVADSAPKSMEELQAAQEELNKQIQKEQEAKKANVISQIVAIVKTYNIPLDELTNALGVKSPLHGTKAPAKYRDPVTGKTWAGRGGKPRWMGDRDPSEFLIK